MLAERIGNEQILASPAVESIGIRIEFPVRVDQISSCHRRGLVLPCPHVFRVDCARNPVGEIVAQGVPLEVSLASVVVEQVLGCELASLCVGMVRIIYVGVVCAVRCDPRSTCPVHAVAVRVVDALPCIFVVILGVVYRIDVVIAQRVPSYSGLERNLRSAFLTLFRRDEDDSVSCPGAVEGCRGGILEDGNRSNVVRVEL